jgi:hypothetical protein
VAGGRDGGRGGEGGHMGGLEPSVRSRDSSALSGDSSAESSAVYLMDQHQPEKAVAKAARPSPILAQCVPGIAPLYTCIRGS